MTLQPLDVVVLTRDIPAHGLRSGDLGAAVAVYSPEAIGVEFVAASGPTQALVTQAGLLRYDVPRHNPFIDQPAVWVGHVVWPQVVLGSITLVASAPLWWFGLKRLRSQPGSVPGQASSPSMQG
jgi:hypothetical protein